MPAWAIALLLNHCADLGAKDVQSKWLGQHIHPGVEEVAAGSSILSISGDKKHLEIGT